MPAGDWGLSLIRTQGKTVEALRKLGNWPALGDVKGRLANSSAAEPGPLFPTKQSVLRDSRQAARRRACR